MKRLLFFLCTLFAPCLCFAQARSGCPNYDPSKIMQIARRNTSGGGLVLISAHRGVWEYALENSVEAVDSASAHCVEISEVDVRLTSDGTPAMIHDWYIQRTSTGTGLIYDQTSATWAQLYLRDRKGNATTQHVPSLTQFLDYMIQNPSQVLVLDCKDSLSVGQTPSPNLKTSAEVIAITYKAIAAYESTHTLLPGQLLDRIIFKMRFPELPQTPNDFLHSLGITGCDSNPSSACTHLNVTSIWYASDETSSKFPGFATWKQIYLNLLTDNNWFWYPEVVVKYPNDSLQSWVSPNQTNGLTVTAFAATSDWAEGTSQGSGQCCGNRNYDITTPADTWNFTGDFEYYVAAQHFLWISTDKAIEGINYLTARGQRNTSYIIH